MKWKEFREICNKHGIVVEKNHYYSEIRFVDIPKTKQYFKRRPQACIFEVSGDFCKDEEDMKIMEKWCGWGSNKYDKAPIFYFQMRDWDEMPDWKIKDCIKKGGTTPTTLFKYWGMQRIPICTKEKLEWAIKDFYSKLDIVANVVKDVDLNNLSVEWKSKQTEVERLTKELESIENKYTQIFRKQAKMHEDF
jgi:hypothetical protein